MTGPSPTIATPPDLTWPEVLEDWHGTRVILLGNGPSALTGDGGGKIDAFERVVRLNNFVTDDLADRVGRRTDLWINGANQGLKRRSRIPERILVMIPSSILREKGLAIHERIRQRLGTEVYHLVPVEEIEALEQWCGLSRPTTGLYGILFLTALGLDLTLHGFDFFLGATHHYFDAAWKRWLKEKGIVRKGSKHSLERERDFVLQLQDVGRIRFLTP